MQLFDAKLVILQVGSARKTDIMERVLRTPPTEDLPATALKLVDNGVLVIDRDAASKAMDLMEGPQVIKG